jgi:hypothetical protein
VTLECENLEAYIAGELPSRAATSFKQHVEECDACREVVEQQAWIDSLLRSSHSASLERAPVAIRQHLFASIAHHRPTTRNNAWSVLSLSKVVLATAATVAIVALGWTIARNRPAANARVPNVANVAIQNAPEPIDTSPAIADVSRRPPATFVSNGDTIAVPLDTPDDDVTVVQLYPTTEAERRTRRELALQFTFSKSDGG